MAMVRDPAATGAAADPASLSLSEASALIARKALSPVELTAAVLARIERLDAGLHAHVTLLPDKAMAAARVAEAEIVAGRHRGPLHGIPYGLEGQLRHRRHPDDRRLPRAARPRAHHRRDAARQAAGGRRGADRQAQHLGIRHRHRGAAGRPVPAATEECLEPGPLHRGLLQRHRRRRGGRLLHARHGVRHRRLGPASRGGARAARAEADLRAAVPRRHPAQCLYAGRRRAADPPGHGRGAGDGRAGRPRPGRPDQRRPARAAPCRGHRGRHEGPDHRRPPPLPHPGLRRRPRDGRRLRGGRRRIAGRRGAHRRGHRPLHGAAVPRMHASDQQRRGAVDPRARRAQQDSR